MKSFRPITVVVLAVSVAGLFGLVQTVFAANTVAKTTKGSPAPPATNAVPANTNAGPVDLPVPLATFDLTNKVVKDPFFPNTLRTPVPVVVSTNVTVAVSAACFHLKALSGTPDQRLALINNRTLAIGESTEISTAQCGKVKVTCLQINESSVVIRIGNQIEPVEVFLPKSAR